MSRYAALVITLRTSCGNFTVWVCAMLCLYSCTPGPSPNAHFALELDQGWTLSGLDTALFCPATVPGTVHTDLLSAGIIDDPFFGTNFTEQNWMEGQRWQYTCTFAHDSAQRSGHYAELVFEGLDTYARIVLNGRELLRADNMFRTWRVPVASDLRDGKNTLEVAFEPPADVHREQLAEDGFVYPADNDASKVAPYTRKAGYHFGWDWVPRFMPVGIWKPVRLEYFQTLVVRHTRMEVTQISEDLCRLRLRCDVENLTNATVDAVLSANALSKTFSLAPGQQTIYLPIEIEHPRLWWPNGEGDAHLYPFAVRLRIGRDTCYSNRLLTGIRTVELVQEPDSAGTPFYFKINGKAVFMRGANYIPLDVFLPRVEESRYRHLLLAARNAGMNMLRVWGGGIYERDIFYNLCDSLGIMVWQDFMFAGTMYPGNDDFMANVEAEAREQVRRLGAHPCMALWCGNNEIEVAWHNWGWQRTYGYDAALQTEMWSDYDALFHHLLPEIVRQEGTGQAYTPTTPLSNWGREENFCHGTMHYWAVWHGREPASAFTSHVGRFMVEYGMQSYPTTATLQPYIPPGQWHLDSAAVSSRQRSYIGNGEILRHMGDMGIAWSDFDSFTEGSHLAQAHALDLAVRAHLGRTPYCMGSLVWQLNDCWPGPSWSIIDYGLAAKPAYYMVQKAFTREMP